MDAEQAEERAALISRMFALLTARFEDAAEIAAGCQARLDRAELLEGANKLLDSCQECVTVAAAILEILRQGQNDMSALKSWCFQPTTP